MKFFKFHAGIMGERQNGAGSQKAGIKKEEGKYEIRIFFSLNRVQLALSRLT